MNGLEFIEEKIENIKFSLKRLKSHDLNDPYLKHLFEENNKNLNILEQIKSELKIMEFIKDGWSSIEQTVNGEKIIKFGKLNLEDWLKVWKTLEEVGLKKALEVKDEDLHNSSEE